MYSSFISTRSTISSSPLVSSISSSSTPSDLSNPWNSSLRNSKETEDYVDYESPIVKRRSDSKDNDKNKRGSLTFYPVYSNCVAPHTQSPVRNSRANDKDHTRSIGHIDDSSHYSTIDDNKRASITSLPCDFSQQSPSIEWKHWGPLYSSFNSSPDEGFEASYSGSSLLSARNNQNSSDSLFNVSSKRTDNFESFCHSDRFKSASCNSFNRNVTDNLFDSLDVDCKVPSMKALHQPLVYDYKTRENLKQQNRLSRGSDISDYLEMDITDGSPYKRDLSSVLNPKHINYFETYWDYWLAKNKLYNLVDHMKKESHPNKKGHKFNVTNCTARKYSYDPEILLAQVGHPMSLADSTFQQYSTRVKTTIIDRLERPVGATHSKTFMGQNTQKQSNSSTDIFYNKCYQQDSFDDHEYFSEPEINHSNFKHPDFVDDSFGISENEMSSSHKCTGYASLPHIPSNPDLLHSSNTMAYDDEVLRRYLLDTEAVCKRESPYNDPFKRTSLQFYPSSCPQSIENLVMFPKSSSSQSVAERPIITGQWNHVLPKRPHTSPEGKLIKYIYI